MQNFISPTFIPEVTAQAKRFWLYSLSLVLAFWVGGTLAIDFVVMPSLANAGMMTSADFIPAGFSLFHRFNGAEVILGSLMLTGTLALLTQNQVPHRKRLGLLSGILFLIPCLYFYYLSPQLAGLGLTHNLSQGVIPAEMESMQSIYWVLDGLKITCVAMYLYELWLVIHASISAQAESSLESALTQFRPHHIITSKRPS